jgi:protein-S-isoprenylcysteine O-methyltransferase Ste14
MSLHVHELKMKLMKNSTYLPVLFLIALVFSLIMFRIFPIRLFNNVDLPLYLGFILFGAGTPLILLAERERHELLSMNETSVCSDFQTGIYKFSRHPGTLGFMVMFFGFGLFLNSGIVIICGVVHMIALTILYIPWVENDTIKICGEGYIEYKKRVRMWF